MSSGTNWSNVVKKTFDPDVSLPSSSTGIVFEVAFGGGVFAVGDQGYVTFVILIDVLGEPSFRADRDVVQRPRGQRDRAVEEHERSVV